MLVWVGFSSFITDPNQRMVYIFAEPTYLIPYLFKLGFYTVFLT